MKTYPPTPEKTPEDKVARYAYQCLCGRRWNKDFPYVFKRWEMRFYLSTPTHYAPVFKVMGQPTFEKCPECGRENHYPKPITGKLNKNVPCDRRCTGARGHTCECSCGGANHGADHVIH